MHINHVSSTCSCEVVSCFHLYILFFLVNKLSCPKEAVRINSNKLLSIVFTVRAEVAIVLCMLAYAFSVYKSNSYL